MKYKWVKEFKILSNIIISLAEEFTAGMNNIINADDSSVDKLKQIVSLHVHITSNNQYGMASLNNDWMHLNETLQHYLKLRKDYEDNFREIIKEGINRKEFNNARQEQCSSFNIVKLVQYINPTLTSPSKSMMATPSSSSSHTMSLYWNTRKEAQAICIR